MIKPQTIRQADPGNTDMMPTGFLLPDPGYAGLQGYGITMDGTAVVQKLNPRTYLIPSHNTTEQL